MTNYKQPRARLYVEEDLAAGRAVPLGAEPMHWLAHVRRLDRGAPLALFNGRDGEWLAEYQPLGKGRAEALCHSQRRPQTAPCDLWLLFAPVKRERNQTIVEKATELGAGRIRPVVTDHTDQLRGRAEKWQLTAIAAAQQCHLLSVPEVAEPAPLFTALAAWDGRPLYWCAESGAARPLAAALAGHTGPAAILTGPEGGFSPLECERLAKLDFVLPVGLGPRILRADTAAIAALGIYQAISGDWRDGAARPPWSGGIPDELP